jgi:hypothetical protein
MKRKSLIIEIVMILSAGFACGKGGYSDYRSALSDLVEAQTKYVSSLQKADKAGDVVNQTKQYITSLTAFQVNRSKLFVEHPELTENVALPSNVATLLEKAAKLDQEIDKALIPAITKFQSDASVMSSWEELNQKRSKM